MEIPLPLPPPVHFASMIDVPGKEGKEGGAVHSSRSLMMAVSRGGGGARVISLWAFPQRVAEGWGDGCGAPHVVDFLGLL